MASSWLTAAWEWIVENPLFSGVGGTALVSIIGRLFGRKQKTGQYAVAKKGSTVIQAGRDANIGNRDVTRK